MASAASSVNLENLDSGSVFSRKLLTQIVSSPSQKKNLVVSPVSIQTCIGLAYFGAKGKTETEIANTLNFASSNKELVGKSFIDLLKPPTNESALLSIANKIYVKKELHVKAEYNRSAKDVFQSEAEAINFEDKETVPKINDWVKSKTNNTIENLLGSVDPDTCILLVNAIYLKAEWKFKFDSHSTHKSDFWLTLDISEKVDFMTNSDYYHYAEFSDLDAIAVGLPYQDSDLSMIILVPNKNNGLEALEKKLAQVDILSLANQMPTRDVDLYLPKFKIESEFNLNDILKKMGAPTMFSDEADFTDLFEEKVPVKVSEVVHKAFINVDEAGTEASAATYMKIVPMSLNLDQKLVKVDRPFLYFIKNQKNIYFIGHVTKFY